MSSFTAMLLLILCANLLIQVENKSVFGIGTRIIGDELLMKDVLQTPPISLTKEPVIQFNYAIIEPITYIEIVSEKNIYANVIFSYENELVEGTVSSINGQHNDTSKAEPFEVLIQIYGLNETMLNVNPAYILNKDQQFNGILQPNYQQDHEALSLMQEDINALDELQLEEYDDGDADADDLGDDDDGDYEDEDDFDEEYDKIIEQGTRQEGDFLVYETNQTSANTTKTFTNHSVIFYYIDIYYITFVKFTLFEHYLDNNPLENYIPPIVEYGHISPTTLKAVVTDHHTKSLFVRMQMYGFHPTTLPVDYKPFLSNGQTSPKSSLRQLKILMNAQQNQQLQQQDGNNNGGLHTPQPYELGQQTASPSSNSNVNCRQQVEANNSGSAGTYGYMTTFNMIITMVVTMIFI